MHDGDHTCNICLNPVRATRHNPPIRCGHIFHRGCIEKWKSLGNNTCPLCRKVFDVSKYKITLTVENQFNATSNTLTLNDEQIFSVLECFDMEIPAEDDADLDSLLSDFGVSLSDLNALVLDAES